MMNRVHTETFNSDPSQGPQDVHTTIGVSHNSAYIRPFPDPYPPEVTDAVIDHLHGDISSLRACALTSSSWLPTSRYHLFNNVCFEDEVSVLRWAKVFPVSSVIPSYVENLHISCVSLLDDFPDVSLDLPTFTGLKALFIGGSNVASVRPRFPNRDCFRKIALFPSKTLRTFSFSYPVIPISTLFFAVRHFPCLDNIHLRYFTALPSDVVEDTGTEASPPFRGTLTLASNLSYGPLVANLLGFSGGIHFSCLNLAVLRDWELPNLRTLVDMCSHTITSLHLTIDLVMLGAESYLFDLSKFHKLSELRLTLHAMRFPAEPFVKMLSSIVDAQPPLCNLTLSLFTWRIWRFKGREAVWDAVDTTLVELSQAVRERSGINLVIQVSVNPLEYGPHDVRDILPRSGEKGLVRLVRNGNSTWELP